ncbi:endonuclease/exonuclease/phosphatase family protein [Candidatus Woesearchaeota archaeon]|nr:endonuclease/exonuclease/phosphatase family protein [Candidatus Woesearchaeota archaeon]
MKQKKPIKIGTLNLQLGVCTTKGYSQYLTTFLKYALPHSVESVDKGAADLAKGLDILTLTEAEAGSKRAKGKNQVRDIAGLADLTEAVFPLYNHGIIGQCNGMCSRYPFSVRENYELAGGIQRRSLGVADVEVDDQNIVVITAHLPLGKGSRKKPLSEIVKVVNEIEYPVILTGDLNTEDKEELKPVTEGTRLRPTDDYKTYPAWNPRLKLDHIFVSPEFEVDDVYVPFVKVSDHLPLVAEVCLR